MVSYFRRVKLPEAVHLCAGIAFAGKRRFRRKGSPRFRLGLSPVFGLLRVTSAPVCCGTPMMGVNATWLQISGAKHMTLCDEAWPAEAQLPVTRTAARSAFM